MQLHNGDCFDVMRGMADNSVDLVLTDPPYGSTACSWDCPFSFDEYWRCVYRITKTGGAIVMTSSQPFTSSLVMSNVANFAHEWVWNKRFAANFVQANRQPLKDHENVLVFGHSGRQPVYFPQKTTRETPIKKGGNKQSKAIPIAMTENADAFGKSKKEYRDKHPTTVTSLEFSSRDMERGLHPTQKPVALMEYLVKTYSTPNSIVLDPFMGSGTTGIACRNLGRDFIGIERDPEYFKIAESRILNHNAAQTETHTPTQEELPNV